MLGLVDSLVVLLEILVGLLVYPLVYLLVLLAKKVNLPCREYFSSKEKYFSAERKPARKREKLLVLQVVYL